MWNHAMLFLETALKLDLLRSLVIIPSSHQTEQGCWSCLTFGIVLFSSHILFHLSFSTSLWSGSGRHSQQCRIHKTVVADDIHCSGRHISVMNNITWGFLFYFHAVRNQGYDLNCLLVWTSPFCLSLCFNSFFVSFGRLSDCSQFFNRFFIVVDWMSWEKVIFRVPGQIIFKMHAFCECIANPKQLH